MKTYVIYNTKTGEIVQTHTEAALSGEPLPVSKEEVVAMYRPLRGATIDPADLDILDVDRELLLQGLSNRKYLCVDVHKRVLSERPKPAGSP